MEKNIKVGITCGDPNGIGCEIVAKALADERFTEICTPVLFGSSRLMAEAAKLPGAEEFVFETVDDAASAQDGSVSLIDCVGDIGDLCPGQIDGRAGQMAVKALDAACVALKDGDIDCLVTAPICKEASAGESFPFTGHTEYLEARLGSGSKALMILFNDLLRVALVTTHMPVSKIADAVTQRRVSEVIEAFDTTLRVDFSIDRPKIAVLSLNPHAGDGGMLGDEEKTEIGPAVADCCAKGILAFGPFAADGFFGSGDFSRYDGIVAMYHDQGLAPFKTLAGSDGVNFTAGLPYVRTSPDHGTAFDIAWKGEADPESMRMAIYKAIDIFRSRSRMLEAGANPLRRYVADKGGKKDKKRADRGDRSDQMESVQDESVAGNSVADDVSADAEV